MHTLAHECLVVPVACSASRFSKQCSSRAAANLWFLDQKCQQYWPKTSVLVFLCVFLCVFFPSPSPSPSPSLGGLGVEGN